MSSWNVYKKNGQVVKATIHKLEFSDEFMGESFITASISSPSPINFEYGDYIEYRGSKYEINYNPTILKQARVNTYGEAFQYENVKFNSLSDELVRCAFLDYVIGDNEKAYFSNPVFSFFAPDVETLADRIQANLDRIYTGTSKWTVVCNAQYSTETDVNVEIDSINCWDALKLAYEKFKANFIISGRTITIGTDGVVIGGELTYGKGNGLVSIEKSSDESEHIITRLRAYGSDRNIPSNYYRNKGLTIHYPLVQSYISGASVILPHELISALNIRWPEYDSHNPESKAYKMRLSLDGELVVTGCYFRESISDRYITISTAYGNTQAQITEWTSQLQSGDYDKIIVVYGADKSKWKYGTDYRTYADYFPNTMAVTRLMLPEFLSEGDDDDVITDPYIDSDNITDTGIREGSVVFDGSSDELYEIYPSIEGMTSAQLIAAGYDVPSQGNLDEIAFDATEIDGSPITDDGTFGGETQKNVKGFQVRIKDIGFDISDFVSSSGEPVLSMKDGMCGGRQFTIKQCSKSGNYYVLNCQRTEDIIYYPNNPFTIKAGDKFVLLNIEMPDVYVDAASQRLKTAATEYLSNHCEQTSTYTPKLDNILLAKDYVANSTNSIYYKIKAGDKIHFSDTDIDIDKTLFIDKLIIREGESLIPQVEVTIRDEKLDSRLSKLQSKIEQTSNTASTTEKNVEKLGNALSQSIIDLIGVPELGLTDETDGNTFSALAIRELLRLKLDKSIFDELFEKVNIGTESNPEYAIHFKLPGFSDQWLSAFGPSSTEGGEGGASILAELLDVIASATNPELVKGLTGDPETDNGKVLTYSSDDDGWVAAEGGQGGGGDKNYVHVQGTSAKIWSVQHNLGKYPSVTIVDYDGNEVIGSVKHNSVNDLTITFNVLVDGKAFCN